MADIKQMSFVLLVILVSVSGVYEWTQTDPVLSKHTAVGSIGAFSVASLTAEITDIELLSKNIVTTSPLTDFVTQISSLIGMLFAGIGLLFKILFGWSDLIRGIFASMGLVGFDLIFIPPIIIIELFGIFYFLRDFINTVRGVSTG